MKYFEFTQRGEPVLVPEDNIAKISPIKPLPLDSTASHADPQTSGRTDWTKRAAELRNAPLTGFNVTIHFRRAAEGKESVSVDQTYEEVKTVLEKAGSSVVAASFEKALAYITNSRFGLISIYVLKSEMTEKYNFAASKICAATETKG